jgi:hypothetical protein
LRVHEAWNIANWDKPVILHSGDWLEIETDDDEEGYNLDCDCLNVGLTDTQANQMSR